MKTIRFHQGDVQGMSTSLPKGAVKISQRPIALGEHSGHQHCVTGDVDLYEFEGRIFVVVGSEGATLQHVHDSIFKETMYKSKKKIQQADHKPIDLEPGTYELRIQNAYNPFKKVFEKVQD
jgi:hypothetical protein